MLRVVACIDDSRAAPAVCDYSVWASRHMEAPLMLLHALVMGAYGHSRIRQFLVGSTTTTMLKTARKPLVILR